MHLRLGEGVLRRPVVGPTWVLGKMGSAPVSCRAAEPPACRPFRDVPLDLRRVSASSCPVCGVLPYRVPENNGQMAHAGESRFFSGLPRWTTDPSSSCTSPSSVSRRKNRGERSLARTSNSSTVSWKRAEFLDNLQTNHRRTAQSYHVSSPTSSLPFYIPVSARSRHDQALMPLPIRSYSSCAGSAGTSSCSGPGDAPPVTSFGARDVPLEEKQRLVSSVFSSVAEQYDLMNDLMSGGLHRCWKNAFVDLIRFPTLDTHPGSGRQRSGLSRRFRILDLAGGTGDIAFRLVEKAKDHWAQQQAIAAKCRRHPASEGRVDVAPAEESDLLQESPCSYSSVDIAVCDINADMLRVGQQRALERGLPILPVVRSAEEIEAQLQEHSRMSALHQSQVLGFNLGRQSFSPGPPLFLQWVHGNGEDLPFPDESFDVVTIAFGIRNFADMGKGLREAARVLRPGGRFLCLEFSRVQNPTLASLYDLYSFNVLPLMGSIVAGDRDAYQYLVESIRRFPPQEEFAAMLYEAGFGHVAFSNLTFGTVAIHSGFKLAA